MQTILGASGQIGQELALSLKRDFTSDIRLVSRKPQTEDTPFQPNGDKGKVSESILKDLLEAMAEGRVNAVIC